MFNMLRHDVITKAQNYKYSINASFSLTSSAISLWSGKDRFHHWSVTTPLILDFFYSFQIYPFPALFLEEAVHVACCLSVPHFRCFIRGTRLNSPVFTPAQLCKCSLRAERVTDAVNSSKRRLLSWRLAIPGSWQGSQQRGGVFEFQERGSETWISICYITPKRSPHDLIWKISATTKNMKSIRCTRRETATKQDFTRWHSFFLFKAFFVGRCGI